MLTERELVQRCMAELCKSAGFAECGNLVQRDLAFLCDAIEAKTGVLISLSTIRRLFNGQFSRLPQVATLNAISVFIGYQSWQHFKLSKETDLGTGTTADTIAEPPVLPVTVSRPGFHYQKFLVAAGVLLFAALGLFFILKPGKIKAGHFDKAQFSVKKTTRNDLPNTVVFQYNLEGIEADSFFIQQSWDRNRRVRIDPKDHTLTDIYYEPGYHVAKLIANEQVIKTVDVSIPTNGWFYCVKEKVPAAIPVYISSPGFKNGLLTMTKEEVLNNNIDIQKENVYVQLNFPGELKYSSDNYKLQCRLRVNQLRNNYCPYFMVEIFCQRYFMFFTSTPKGCASEMMAQFGENFVSGKTNDLSAMSTDAKEWQDIEVVVRNKKAIVKINNTEVFSREYAESAGMLTGLGFISNGIPEVDFVKMTTLGGEVIYESEFEN